MNRFAFIAVIKNHDATTAKIIAGPSNDIVALQKLETELKFGSKQDEIKDGEIVAYGELNMHRVYRKPTAVELAPPKTLKKAKA